MDPLQQRGRAEDGGVSGRDHRLDLGDLGRLGHGAEQVVVGVDLESLGRLAYLGPADVVPPVREDDSGRHVEIGRLAVEFVRETGVRTERDADLLRLGRRGASVGRQPAVLRAHSGPRPYGGRLAIDSHALLKPDAGRAISGCATYTRGTVTETAKPDLAVGLIRTRDAVERPRAEGIGILPHVVELTATLANVGDAISGETLTRFWIRGDGVDRELRM